jgi:hypothetical protein
MSHLKTTQYKLNIPHLRLYPKKIVFIKSLILVHYIFIFEIFLWTQTYFASHILCLNETKIQNISM